MKFSNTQETSDTATALALSSALTGYVRQYDLSAQRDKVVVVLDPEKTPDWKMLPTIWHTPNNATITVNLGRVLQTTNTKARHSVDTKEVLKYIAASIAKHNTFASTEDAYETYTSQGKLNKAPLRNKHRKLNDVQINAVSINDVKLRWEDMDSYRRISNTLISLIAREASFDVTHQQVLDSPEFDKANEYQKNIIRTLEEVRMDYQFAKRIYIPKNTPIEEQDKTLGTPGHTSWAAASLISSTVTRPSEQIIQEMLQPNEDGEISIPRAALYSTLILGLPTNFTEPSTGIKKFAAEIDSLVGSDRYDEMMRILDRYIHTEQPTNSFIKKTAETWEELFPADPSGQSTTSTMTNPDGSGESGEGEGEGEGEDGEGEGESEGQDGNGSGDPGDTDASESPTNGEGSDGDPQGQDTPPQENASGPQDYKDLENTGGEITQHGTRGATAESAGAKSSLTENDDSDPGKDETARLAGLESHLKNLLRDPHADNTAETMSLPAESPKPTPTPSRVSYNAAKHRRQSKNAAELASNIEKGREVEPTTIDRAAAQQLSQILLSLNVRDRGRFLTSELLPPGRLNSRAAVQQAAERRLHLPQQAKPWKRTRHTVDLNPPVTVGIMTDVSGSMGWAERISARFAWIIQHAVNQIHGRTASVAFGDGATITLRPDDHLKNAQVVRANGAGENFDMAIGALDVMLNLINGTGTRILFVFTDGQFVIHNMMPIARQWLDQLRDRGITVVWVTPLADETNDGYRYTTDRLPNTPEGVTVVSARPLKEALKSRNKAHNHYDVWESRPHCPGCDIRNQEVDRETTKIITVLGQSLATAVQNAYRG